MCLVLGVPTNSSSRWLLGVPAAQPQAKHDLLPKQQTPNQTSFPPFHEFKKKLQFLCAEHLGRMNVNIDLKEKISIMIQEGRNFMKYLFCSDSSAFSLDRPFDKVHNIHSGSQL